MHFDIITGYTASSKSILKFIQVNRIIILLFCLLFFSTPVFSQNHNLDFSEYRSTLDNLFSQIMQRENVSDSLLVLSFPKKGEEYSVLLYEYTHPDSSKALHNAYHQRWSLIHGRMESGNKPIIRQYLLFSRVIDGYEAEPYFQDDLPHYLNTQKSVFCKVFQNLKKESYELPRLTRLFKVCQ